MAHRALDADNRHPSRRQRKSWMTRHHEVGPEGCRRAAHLDTRPSAAKSDERSSTPLGRDCLARLPPQRRRLVEGGNNRATRHTETGRNEVAKAAAGPAFLQSGRAPPRPSAATQIRWSLVRVQAGPYREVAPRACSVSAARLRTGAEQRGQVHSEDPMLCYAGVMDSAAVLLFSATSAEDAFLACRSK